MCKSKWLRPIIAVALFVAIGLGMCESLADKAVASPPYSSPNSITITLDANGGTIKGKSQYTFSVRPGTRVTVPYVIPEFDGHRFLGWAETLYADTASFYPGSAKEFYREIRYYAVWCPYMEYSEDIVEKLNYDRFFRVYEGGKYHNYGAEQGYVGYKDTKKYALARAIQSAFEKVNGKVYYKRELYQPGNQCGTFAAVNTFIYTQRANKTLDEEIVGNYIIEYYRLAGRSAGRQLTGGETPDSLMAYFMKKGFKSVFWKEACTDYAISDIKKMLSKEIPVIMSIYNDSGRGVYFYTLNKNAHRLIKRKEDINDHYFIITGVYQDSKRQEDIWIEAISWAGLFYFSWNDYCTHTCTTPVLGSVSNGYMYMSK